MCNDFGKNVPYSDYLAAFSQTRSPVKWPSAAPNLEPREDIWPTARAPVIQGLEGRDERVNDNALGLCASMAKGSARHQFPFRGPPVPGREMSRARLPLL
jgi:hypothetical protein